MIQLVHHSPVFAAIQPNNCNRSIGFKQSHKEVSVVSGDEDLDPSIRRQFTKYGSRNLRLRRMQERFGLIDQHDPTGSRYKRQQKPEKTLHAIALRLQGIKFRESLNIVGRDCINRWRRDAGFTHAQLRLPPNALKCELLPKDSLTKRFYRLQEFRVILETMERVRRRAVEFVSLICWRYNIEPFM